METNQDLHELEELKDGMALLKERMEQEKVIGDKVLYALIAKEMVRLDNEYITNAVISPLILYPMMIGILIFDAKVPIPIILGIGASAYVATFWFIWRKRDKTVRERAFGRMGKTVTEVEAYCQKKLNNFWGDLAKYMLLTASMMSAFVLLGLYGWGFAAIVYAAMATFGIFTMFNLRRRYRRILRGIDAVSSELG